jgi:thiol-disulfide isomerase/thioredoxin
MTQPSPPETTQKKTSQPDATAPRKRRRWYAWLIEITFFLGIFLAVRAYMAPAIPVAYEHTPIPVITLPTVTGDTTTLGANHQPTALVFWATWCGVCHVELPWLNELAKTHRIITVAMQSGSTDAVREYLNKNQLNQLTVINDPDGQIAKKFGVSVTPTLLFLAPDGHIAMAETGITSPWGIRLRLWWLGL